jgi:hypothetical protein
MQQVTHYECLMDVTVCYRRAIANSSSAVQGGVAKMHQIRGVSPHALLKRMGSAFLMMVSLQAVAENAQPTVGENPTFGRSFTFSQGFTRQDYREPDPLGRVNPLDTETGSIPSIQATMRWNGKLSEAIPEIDLQFQVSHAQGQTDYSGYLQQGSELTLYSARTSNAMRAYSLRFGLPLSTFTRQHLAQHFAPYLEQRLHHWQRNLAQYGESFTWQSTNFGVMARFRLADLGLDRFTVEADWSIGRTRNAIMTTPTLGFAAPLGSARTHSAALALHYEVTPTWFFGFRFEELRMRFGGSPTLAGLQYPGSSTNEKSFVGSLTYRL